ncbi:MAG: DUF2095 domain-containing protein [Candidatus Bathyarchaeota archaeon]|nr:DUF2095 domain-containing protein [Candidatus Bathyarchaeota archaeon]
MLLKAVPMEIDKRTFKKMFPHLAKELEGEEGKIAIKAVRTDSDVAEKAVVNRSTKDKFRNYNPTVIDFIRRCDTEEQADEIITFLEKRGELTPGYAEELRKQLKCKGVRSFGSKKEENYYFKEGGLC